VRNLLQEQANEISSMTADIVKSAGVDLSIKAKKLMEDINNRFMPKINASVDAAAKAAAAAEEAAEGLGDIAAAAAVAVSGTPMVITDVTTAVEAAKNAAEDANTKADEAKKKADDPKTAQPNQLEKTADEVKAFEIEAIKQSAIAVKNSKEVKKQAFDQVKAGIEKWHEEAKGKLNDKDKNTIDSINHAYKGLSGLFVELDKRYDKSNEPVKEFIDNVSSKKDELTTLSRKIQGFYSEIDTELKKIVIDPLTAVSPSDDFKITVKTANTASREITEKIGKLQAEITTAENKVNECNDLITRINTEIAQIDETAAAAAAAAAAVAALRQTLEAAPNDSDGANLLSQIKAELAKLPPAALAV
jgi:chromosome segregation ATPase